MEDPSGDRPRRGEQTDREQLAQPASEMGALRDRRQRRARPRVLGVGPVAHPCRRIVLDKESDLRAVDPTGRIDLLHGELRALLLRRAVHVR